MTARSGPGAEGARPEDGPFLTLDAVWQSFAAHVLRDAFSDGDKQLLRVLFFGGAAAVLRVMTDRLSADGAEVDSVLSSMTGELDEHTRHWAAEIVRRDP